MKLLFFGDIVARPGRQAVAQVLPQWRQTYQPDLVVGCVDNLAHGKGATSKTLQELIDLGFAAFTTGDHVLNSPAGLDLLSDDSWPLIRPLNAPADIPGAGYKILSVGDQEILLVHLLGQVFMPGNFTSPFSAIDELLAGKKLGQDLTAIFIDIHAEATSEKVAMGWYLDGRVTGVLGTHTHIPTCDEWIMPKSTAYVTDIGMTGVRESVLGVKTEIVLKRFLNQATDRFEPAATGTVMVAAVLIELNEATGLAKRIERLQTQVVIG